MSEYRDDDIGPIPWPLARLCTCGHPIYAHDDDDGGTHECQLCSCQQFVDTP